MLTQVRQTKPLQLFSDLMNLTRKTSHTSVPEKQPRPGLTTRICTQTRH